MYSTSFAQEAAAFNILSTLKNVKEICSKMFYMFHATRRHIPEVKLKIRGCDSIKYFSCFQHCCV
jgi:hypothetical protein